MNMQRAAWRITAGRSGAWAQMAEPKPRDARRIKARSHGVAGREAARKGFYLTLTLSLICLSWRSVGVLVFFACYYTFLREERRDIEGLGVVGTRSVVTGRGWGSDGQRTTTMASG